MHGLCTPDVVDCTECAALQTLGERAIAHRSRRLKLRHAAASGGNPNSDGARSDGARSDGARSDGGEGGGDPRISSRLNSISSATTDRMASRSAGLASNSSTLPLTCICILTTEVGVGSASLGRGGSMAESRREGDVSSSLGEDSLEEAGELLGVSSLGESRPRPPPSPASGSESPNGSESPSADSSDDSSDSSEELSLSDDEASDESLGGAPFNPSTRLFGKRPGTEEARKRRSAWDTSTPSSEAALSGEEARGRSEPSIDSVAPAAAAAACRMAMRARASTFASLSASASCKRRKASASTACAWRRPAAESAPRAPPPPPPSAADSRAPADRQHPRLARGARAHLPAASSGEPVRRTCDLQARRR